MRANIPDVKVQCRAVLQRRFKDLRMKESIDLYTVCICALKPNLQASQAESFIKCPSSVRKTPSKKNKAIQFHKLFHLRTRKCGAIRGCEKRMLSGFISRHFPAKESGEGMPYTSEQGMPRDLERKSERPRKREREREKKIEKKNNPLFDACKLSQYAPRPRRPYPSSRGPGIFTESLTK